MNMNPIKAWRRVLLLATWTVFFIIIAIMIYLIPSRWDEQAQGESLSIESYKAEIQESQVKD